MSLADLTTRFREDEAQLEDVVRELVRDARLSEVGESEPVVFRAETFVVPVGNEQGWEAAVFDHFQAVATAIAQKLRLRSQVAQANDRVGGATLSFEISARHPHAEQVLGLLRRVRGEVNEIYNQVSSYNDAHPIAEDEKIRVWFYFGQSVEETGDRSKMEKER